MTLSRVRVLIVDDSSIVCHQLAEVMGRDPQIEVVGFAPDPYVAREKIIELKPDVITLDMQMPRMDGVTFLRKIMRYHPLPVIVISSFTTEGASLSLDALQYGAVDVMAKPSSLGSDSDDFNVELCEKVKIAASVRVHPLTDAKERRALAPRVAERPAQRLRPRPSSRTLIGIGASTGGTEAIRTILEEMPEDAPPILIVQHMPAGFTRSFAERLNQLCTIEVLEAANNMEVVSGRAIIAQGGCHMILRESAGKFVVQVKDGPLVCRHKPSVEVLFNSLAKMAGIQAVGCLCTGMGRDGAQGLKNLRDSGARTLVQDEATSVVFGMPKEAILLGAAESIVPLEKICGGLLAYAYNS